MDKSLIILALETLREQASDAEYHQMITRINEQITLIRNRDHD